MVAGTMVVMVVVILDFTSLDNLRVRGVRAMGVLAPAVVLRLDLNVDFEVDFDGVMRFGSLQMHCETEVQAWVEWDVLTVPRRAPGAWFRASGDGGVAAPVGFVFWP